MKPILDQVVADCLDITHDKLESIKQRIPLGSLEVMDSILTHPVTASMPMVGLRLAFTQIYEVVIYTVMMERLDIAIAATKNKKKVPQLERQFMRELKQLYIDTWVTVVFEFDYWRALC